MLVPFIAILSLCFYINGFPQYIKHLLELPLDIFDSRFFTWRSLRAETRRRNIRMEHISTTELDGDLKYPRWHLYERSRLGRTPFMRMA